jgi:hypothetical protein
MSVDGQSDDGNHLSERSDGDRHKESDRSNPSNASGHKNDDNDDTSDAGSEQASIATDMQDESEDDARIVLRHDAQNTMLSERLTSDEDDDSGDDWPEPEIPQGAPIATLREIRRRTLQRYVQPQSNLCVMLRRYSRCTVLWSFRRPVAT